MINDINNLIEGISGVTQPMVSGLLRDQYKLQSPNVQKQIQGIAFKASRHKDEDISRTGEWLLRELRIVRLYTPIKAS